MADRTDGQSAGSMVLQGCMHICRAGGNKTDRDQGLNDTERRVAEKRLRSEKIKILEEKREKEMAQNGEQLSLTL